MELNVYPERHKGENVGGKMFELIVSLYPLCRSITGNGVRETLKMLKEIIPLEVHEIPTGTAVFDWIIPKEWNIRDAYIKNSRGERIVDFQKSNLHVVNYSVPINEKMPFRELKNHLFTLPEYPEWIPYRTSYYKEDWGFCLSHNQFLSLKDKEYEVRIDSTLKKGHLSFGEYYLKGQTEEEILISCHICHPSLCNDNLSGISAAVLLAQYLRAYSIRYSYRFLFIPGTIGSIAWLSRNEERASRIKHGLVLAGLGDKGKITYKKSRRGDAEIDKAVVQILKESNHNHDIIDFSPYGYDERQYCSPGFNLPVGCLMRTPHGCYKEYHTSADNPEFVRPEFLEDSFYTCLQTIILLEKNKRCINLNPKCEPQLGKRGLYESMGGSNDSKTRQLAMLWVLNLSDGQNTLLDIAGRSGLGFNCLSEVAELLLQKSLLEECKE